MTDDEKIVMIYKIGIIMKRDKQMIPCDLILDAMHYAYDYEGIYDLMLIWIDEEDEFEKAETIRDIQEMINEVSKWNS